MKKITLLLFTFIFIASAFSQKVDLIPYRLDSLWGYADTNGNIVIQPRFKSVDFFKGDLAEVGVNENYLFINSKGEVIVPFGGTYFPECNIIRTGLCNYVGLVNKDKDTILPFKYDIVSGSCDCKFFINKGIDYFLFDAKQKKIIKLNYDKIYIDNYEREFRYDLVLVQKNKKSGYLNCKGDEIIPPIYDECFAQEDETIPVKLNGKSGLFNQKGKIIIPPDCDFYTRIAKNYFLKKDSHWFFVDSSGRNFLNQNFDTISYFNNNYDKFFVGKNGKFGVLDLSGKTLFPIVYDYISPVGQNLFIVGKENKYGLIDSMNSILVPIKYLKDSALENPTFNLQLDWERNKYIIAKFNGKFGFVDAKSLKEVVPFKYDGAVYFINGLSRVFWRNKMGLIDTTGKEILPIKYDAIEDIPNCNYLFHVTREKKSGYADLKGHEFFGDTK